MKKEDVQQLESLLKEFLIAEIDKGNVYKLEPMAETLQRIRFHDLGSVGLSMGNAAQETLSNLRTPKLAGDTDVQPEA